MKKVLLSLSVLLIHITLLSQTTIQVGADRIEELLTQIQNKRIALVVNHTSILSNNCHTHLIDTLHSREARLTRIFTPEHGLHGTASAGESINTTHDDYKGIQVVSLYGKSKRPTQQHLKDIELVIFDLQDVGARFYTYLSTLFYVMDACAEYHVPLLILDRPNPHDTIDGPMLISPKYQSFVGIIPIPVVHGLTLGEAAMMINGEKWLPHRRKVQLSVLKILHWQHGTPYSLPVAPSPNLRTDRAIMLYPTLCFIEGTSWSEGRGTSAPFEQIGYPHPKCGSHTFIPETQKGASSPKHEGKLCYGPDLSLRYFSLGINVEMLCEVAQISKRNKIKLITREHFFDLLAGNKQLRYQLNNGTRAHIIRAGWQRELKCYAILRQKYLLYRDDRRLLESL